MGSLSDHERKLLSDLRESLFEKHGQMKTMFERLDKARERLAPRLGFASRSLTTHCREIARA